MLLADDSILQIVSITHTSYILKLKPDETLDSAFGKNGKLQLACNNFLNLVLQGCKIIVYFGPKNLDFSNYINSKIVRYHPNGILNLIFGNNGVLNEVTESTNPPALSVLLLADQSFTETKAAEINHKKYKINGQLDTAFGESGVINYNYNYPLGQFLNRKIVTCDVSFLSSSVFSFF